MFFGAEAARGRGLREVAVAAAILSSALSSGLAAPPSARAHGRPAAVHSVVSDPSRPSRWVAQATWGLALSDDGGGRWRWLCAAAMGVDARSEDPVITVMADGRMVAGTFAGLIVSDDDGCTWTTPASALTDRFIVDLHRVDERTALAIAARSGAEDRLFRTDDAAATWRELDGRFGEVLVDRVRTAPSAPLRVYASGGTPATGAHPTRRAFLLRSDDGGDSFVPFELPLETGERQLIVWAIDRVDPDLLYGQVLHFNGEDAPERVVRSEDGGETWETVLRIPYIGGILSASDGSVYAGSRLGGLHRALDGQAFSPIDETLPVTCLSEIVTEDGAVLVACVDQALAGYAMARSDDGVRFEPAVRLSEIHEPHPCPRCSPAGATCPAWAPDVIVDLGLDAALPEGFDRDAATGAPRDAGVPIGCGMDAGVEPPAGSGCGCRIGPSGRPASGLWWLLAAALLWRGVRNGEGRCAA